MKKIYLFTCLLSILVRYSTAQITITRSDFGSIGDVVLYGNDTTLTDLSVGASGANKTWDFTNRVIPDVYETSRFVNPTTIPGSPAEANLAIDGGIVAGASFFNIDNTKVKTILALGNFGLDNQQLTITTFPLNYGDIIKDSTLTKRQGTQADFGLSGLPYDSLRIMVDIHTQSAADGWGTLITPTGTYNTLRVKNITNVDVTILGKLPFFGWSTVPVNPDRRQILYAWYGNGKRYSLAEAELDSNGVVTSFRYQVDSIPKQRTGLLTLSGTAFNPDVFPNPANDFVVFKGIPVSGAQVDIIDVTGRLISRNTIENQDSKVDIQAIPEGIYTALVRADGTATAVKLVIAR